MAQCYDWNSDTQQVEQLPSSIWFQCPSGNTCCIGGTVCLDYNLCHTPGSSTKNKGSYSSYYVARCSDPTYTSPECQKVCNAPGPPDAVYNYTSHQWNCCGNDASGNVSCDNPTSEVFQAPAPANLVQLVSGVAIVSTETLTAGAKSSTTSSTSSGSAGTASSMSTSTSIGTAAASSQPGQTGSSSTSTSSSNTSASTSLSTGAKAGIGIGIALAVVVIAALVFFLLRRRRRSPTVAGAGVYGTEHHKNGPRQYSANQTYAGGTVVAPIEKSAYSEDIPRSELSSTKNLVGEGGMVGAHSGRFHEIGTSR